MNNLTFFADYNCGVYSSDDYQRDCTAGSQATGSSPLDSLANTGYDVLIPVFLGASLIAASAVLFVRRWLRARKHNRALVD